MKRLLLGSGNHAKLQELREILAGLPVDLVTLNALPVRPPEAPETGDTFLANATQKALHYAQHSGMAALADDSGLCVDALGGAPGVISARWSGPAATDASNNAKLLRSLDGVPEGKRTAAYHAVIVLALPGRVLLTAEGRCRGEILRNPQGNTGFGYDPLFFLPNLGKTFAEIPPAQKHGISHRGEALRRLLANLPEVLPLLEMS
ncbi:MAG: RdgB/HAM1 family non-canonical purine NTP pyrophosphatase [Planctomycetes bacterium]|nr:RdgB/HAM1 family non-canonical purine NTP pyrophosphatase [Planctomycetota bacterium]